MINNLNKSQENKSYNLEKRTTLFAKNLITVLRKIRINPINKRLIEQLVGSSGSIGANYYEATEAESPKDFIHKMGIAKKEIKETKHWIELLAVSDPEKKDQLRLFWRESDELLKIFSQSIITARKNANH